MVGYCEQDYGFWWTQWWVLVNKMVGSDEHSVGFLWTRLWVLMNTMMGSCKHSDGFLWTRWWVLVNKMMGSCEQDDGFWWTRWWVLVNKMMGSCEQDYGFLWTHNLVHRVLVNAMMGSCEQEGFLYLFNTCPVTVSNATCLLSLTDMYTNATCLMYLSKCQVAVDIYIMVVSAAYLVHFSNFYSYIHNSSAYCPCSRSSTYMHLFHQWVFVAAVIWLC
jgi:hypothetical protein